MSSQPYPVYLAYPLERDLLELGELKDWQVEWKWDGIRAQVVRRGGATYIWSRSGELITDRFPEVQVLASKLPDGTVLDGELTGWKEGRVLPFGDLQQRIGRKSLSSCNLGEASGLTNRIRYLGVAIARHSHTAIAGTKKFAGEPGNPALGDRSSRKLDGSC